MNEQQIKELEKKFKDECCDDGRDGDEPFVFQSPKDTFQWIVDNVIRKGESPYCNHCGKRLKMKGDGSVYQLCEC